jgi:hypothetical protein
MWSLRDILSGFFGLTLPKRIPLPLKLQQGDSFFCEFSIYPLVKLLARTESMGVFFLLALS